MNLEDAARVVDLLTANYWNSFKGMSDAQKLALIDTYAARFADDPVDVVLVALGRYIDENEYPPSVAGLKKRVKYLNGIEDYEKMWHEAWAGICGNVRFDDMCPENKAYFGSQHNLDELGQSEKTLQGVEKGLYMKRIPEIVDGMETREDAKKRLGVDRMNELGFGPALKRLVVQE